MYFDLFIDYRILFALQFYYVVKYISYVTHFYLPFLFYFSCLYIKIYDKEDHSKQISN